MIEETGRVIGRSGGTVTVRIERDSNCAGCQSCRTEGAGTSIVATARDPLHVHLGDRVKLRDRAASEAKIGSGKAGFLLFGLPLLSFVAGFAGGQYLGRVTGVGSPDMIGLAGGLAGLAVPLLFLYLRHRRSMAAGAGGLVVAGVVGEPSE